MLGRSYPSRSRTVEPTISLRGTMRSSTVASSRAQNADQPLFGGDAGISRRPLQRVAQSSLLKSSSCLGETPNRRSTPLAKDSWAHTRDGYRSGARQGRVDVGGGQSEPLQGCSARRGWLPPRRRSAAPMSERRPRRRPRTRTHQEQGADATASGAAPLTMVLRP